MTNKIDKIQMPDGQVLKLNGGSGLEVCDIGMALYVDETKGLRRYLNGQIVDINTNTQAFLNRLLEIKNTNPDYFTTEDNWQSEALLNIDGCVYKFVLNYSGETVISVRLPKYPDYVEINAGGTLPVVGNGTTLGLTDGVTNAGWTVYNGPANSYVWNANGYGTSVGTTVTHAESFTDAKTIGVTTDPTKSGIQTTLKQTKLKMRYFIQIATGSETENSIINDIELNNPYSLFDNKYSDHELNNLSWLKSEGQWNAKAVYTEAYDKLLKVYNGTETVEGLSVKLSTETYTDYDFVLNTADETFRLPLKTKLASGKAVVGNGMTLGLSQNGDYGLASATLTSQQKLLAWTSAFGVQAGIALPDGGVVSPSNTTVGITTDPTKSGIELSDSGLYLYFYVGETVQNANLIDAGRIGEQLANKQDKCIHIIDTYVNGTSGYRVWSDGYCVQWGIATTTSNSAVYLSVTFIKKFRDTNYNLIKNNDSGNSNDLSISNVSVGYISTTSKSTDGFRCIQTASFTGLAEANWEASGYLAEGEY